MPTSASTLYLSTTYWLIDNDSDFIAVGPDTSDGIDGFLDVIEYLLSQNNPPHVVTTSYGFGNELSAGIAQ